MNRVLTLEEVLALEDGVEWYAQTKIDENNSLVGCVFHRKVSFERLLNGIQGGYGVKWRVWLRKPTTDELAAWPWEAQ